MTKRNKKPRANRAGQHSFFSKTASDYGGALRNSRKGRAGARPLAVKSSMHIVLRSTQATGERSFKAKRNEKRVVAIIRKFSETYSVKILSFANVGNHLHFNAVRLSIFS